MADQPESEKDKDKKTATETAGASPEGEEAQAAPEPTGASDPSKVEGEKPDDLGPIELAMRHAEEVEKQEAQPPAEPAEPAKPTDQADPSAEPEGGAGPETPSQEPDKQPAAEPPKGEEPSSKQVQDPPPPKPDPNEPPFPDMPADEWNKLSRDGKAVVSHYRNEGRRLREQVDEFNTFCRERSLNSQMVSDGLTVIAGLQAGDRNVIPFLEESLANIRRIHGIEAPSEKPVVTTEEWEAALKEAEDYNLAPLRKIGEKLTKPPAPPKPAAAPAQPAGTPGPTAEQLAEQSVNEAILDFCAEVCVGTQQDPTAYAQELVKEITREYGARPPLKRRLSLVQKKHRERAASRPAKAPTKAPPPPKPVAGGSRGGSTKGGEAPDNRSPLEVAGLNVDEALRS